MKSYFLIKILKIIKRHLIFFFVGFSFYHMLYMTVEYPCALNLSIKASSAGFSISPSSIELSAGMIEAPFRIAVPRNFETGTYTINWQIEGELTPAYYTPVQKSTVLISSKKIKISNSELTPIPANGTTLPLRFTLDYAPATSLVIKMKLSEKTANLTYDKSTLSFAPGMNEQFIVFKSRNLSDGFTTTLKFTLSGTNANEYELEHSELSLSVYNNTETNPEIKEFAVTAASIATINVRIQSSQIGHCYVMIALNGTFAPTFTEVKN